MNRADAMRAVANRQIARRMESDRSLFRMRLGHRFYAVRSGMEAVRLNTECGMRVLDDIVRERERGAA